MFKLSLWKSDIYPLKFWLEDNIHPILPLESCLFIDFWNWIANNIAKFVGWLLHLIREKLSQGITTVARLS